MVISLNRRVHILTASQYKMAVENIAHPGFTESCAGASPKSVSLSTLHQCLLQPRTASLVLRWLLNWFFFRPPSSSLPAASSGASPASSSRAALAFSPSSFSPSVSPTQMVTLRVEIAYGMWYSVCSQAQNDVKRTAAMLRLRPCIAKLMSCASRSHHGAPRRARRICLGNEA